MTDPLAHFREWQEAAVAAGVTLPEAMTLATADEARPPLGPHGSPQRT